MRRFVFVIIPVVIVAGVFLLFPKKETNTKPLQSFPHLSGKITNQWYSSAFFKDWPQTLYSFPLSYKIAPKSILVSGPQTKATASTVYSSFQNDLEVLPSMPFFKQEIVDTGDMHVTFKLYSPQTQYLVTVAHGVPTIWIKNIGSDSKLTLHSNKSDQALLTSDELESRVLPVGDTTVDLPVQKYIAITLQPDEVEIDPRSISAPLTSSSVSYSVGDLVNINLSYSDKTLITLLPHQWSRSSGQFLGSYSTLRGEMKALTSNTISYSLPLANPLPIEKMLSSLTEQEKNILKGKVDQDFALIKKESAPAGVYDAGKWLFKLAQVVEIAEALEHPEKDNIRKLLEDSLIVWLGEDSSKFKEVNDPWGVIAATPQFGNEVFNDHHFHYGYFLAAAGIAMEQNPEITDSINKTSQLLLRDVESRGFDAYESHSWAGGYGDFADGNNQESTSEAINRWYGIYRFGKALGEQKYIDLGLVGIAMEQDAASTYWLVQNPQTYSPEAGFTGEIISLLWGGKIDFGTWFSAKPTHIYGIQFLPMSPAMTHITKTFKNYIHDASSDAWNDIRDMVAAVTGEDVADSQAKYEPGNSASFYYLWVKYWEN